VKLTLDTLARLCVAQQEASFLCVSGDSGMAGDFDTAGGLFIGRRDDEMIVGRRRLSPL
jgi:hypothetical protein